MPARMMVFATIKPGEEKAFEEAFKEVTSKVKGTPGHISDELLRDVSEDRQDASPDEPSRYILLSEWESTEAFLAWEHAPIHMQTTTPMRPYWAGRVERRMYEVAVRLYSDRPAD
jgi:heme oxygenase (mycobilin-producing)